MTNVSKLSVSLRRKKTMNQPSTYPMKEETYIWDKGYKRPTEEDRIYTFVSSCIESAANQLGCKASDMYRRMENVGLVSGYLIPCYNVLHTESRSNVTADVIETLLYWEEKKGVKQ